MAYDAWAGTGSAALALLLTGGVLAAAVLALASPASLPGSIVPAAVAASGLAVPAFAFFTAGASGDFPSLRPVAVLAGLALAALYLVGPSPGHTFHLTLLAAAVWLAAVALTGSAGLLVRTGTLAETLVSAGLVSAAVGGGQLAAGRWLDGAGLAGMATPLLGVGAAAAMTGAAVIWFEAGPVAGTAGLALTAAALAAAAAPGRRRGLLWSAAAAASAATVALADAVVPGRAVAPRAVLVAALGAALALGTACRAGSSDVG